MKTAVVFLLMWFGVSAQTFQFDRLTTYNVSRKEIKQDRIALSKVGNSSYFMRLYKEGSELKAAIDEMDKRISHYFNVKETKNTKGKKEMKFTYLRTESYKNWPIPEKTYFAFETLVQDSSQSTVNLLLYKNEKKKKPKSRIALKFNKAESPRFALYRYCCFHPNESEVAFDSEIPGIVESSVNETSGMVCRLISDEIVALEVILPANLNHVERQPIKVFTN
ncbi:hypothetical protein [Flavobacterium sp.]|uniref:hypothetical protein n=1 Tax=Flavobacterium sp. TaxID=239 RepID=UPI0011F486DD|nr:hypothetical protein [Flavobacterium sp.]RZJ71407.1 MAG: hypothetical protein EOO49_10120 [Flavobacterium sp.]